MKFASGRLVVFCDADDVASPVWLAAHVEASGGADITGGPLVPLAPTGVLPSGFPPTDRLPLAFDFLPYVAGANCSLSVEVWRRLGGWNETYPAGGEDIDFCWRAQLAGYTIGFAPAAGMGYRLRHGWRNVALQHLHYGRGDRSLARTYRDQLPRTGLMLRELRQWAWLLTHLADLAVDSRRNRWVAAAAFSAGRLLG